MKLSLFAISCILLICISSSTVFSNSNITRDTRDIEITKGRRVKITTLDIPTLSRLRPILLVIPAKKYLTDGEIFDKAAIKIAEQGIYVIRFDWSFSFDGLSKEDEKKFTTQDIYAIFKFLKTNPSLDQNKLLVLAKSFGATILTEQFSHIKTLSIFLMTPNCDNESTFEKRFSTLYKKRVPIEVAISIDDPYCDVQQIRAFETKLHNSQNHFYYLSGDHNFTGEKSAVSEVVNLIYQWTKKNKNIN